MANTVFIDSLEALTKFRIFSESTTTSWNGSAMQAHASIADYTTNGVLTVTSSQTLGGSDGTRYTVTIPDDLPAGTYNLAGWVGNPAIGTWTAGLKEFVWDDTAIVSVSSISAGVVVPLSAVLTDYNVPQVDLPLAQYESRTIQITFLDDDGDPVSFQGDTVTCVVSTIRGTTALAEVSCTVNTTNYNVIQIPFTSAHTASAGTFRHSLWSETDDTRIAFGAVPIARTLAPTT